MLTEFGHLVETFAVGEILKQVSWSDEVATAAYFRTQNGDEVDLVLETWDGRVAGFEVKAGSRVQDADLSGLRLLRDRLGERFMAGFLLNLGELAYRKEERIMVMPLSGLWSLASSRDLARPGQGRAGILSPQDVGQAVPTRGWLLRARHGTTRTGI